MKKLFTLIAAALLSVGANAASRTTLWEGEQTMDATWPSVQIAASAFSTAKSGDAIVVTISKADNSINTEWTYGPQIFIKVTADTWADLSDASVQYPTNGTENAEFSFKLTDDGLAQINAGTGIAVQGMNVIVTKIELEASVATTAKELTLTEGHTILSSEFDGYADSLQVKISISNNTDPYASRNGWGIGGFANADNWSPTYNITAADGASFDVYVTVGDLKTAAKNGTDAYVVSEYNRSGVTFNIYNDCKITGVYVLVPESDGVTAVKMSERNENGKIYNFSGQEVSKSYRGFVIQGGRKYYNQ